MIGLQVGDCGVAIAQAILHQIRQLLAPGCIPLFLSDGNPNYLSAIVGHFGHWVQPPRRENRGRWPKPHTSDGSGIDELSMVTARRPNVPGAAVAQAADGVRNGTAE